MEREVERFEAMAEDGRRFTIIVYADMIDVGSRDNRNAEIFGLRRMVTTEGYAVTAKADDLYHITSLELLVRRGQSFP